MIKYTSNKQISIEDFIQPFGGKLSKDNRWVKMALLLPWDDMVLVYARRMSLKMGRAAIDPRIAVGALLAKHIMATTDEDIIEHIKENPYIQYFLGYSEYRYKQPFTPSLFVRIRKRLGGKQIQEMTEGFMKEVHKVEKKISDKNKRDEDQKGNDAKEEKENITHKGHLIVDATVAPADIKFPTDLDLLNESREKSEQLIDLLYLPEKGKIKPRTYRKKARKEYLGVAKQRKKQRKPLRKALRKQLGYVSRNIQTIEKLLDEKESVVFPLAHKYQRMYWIIREVYRQQQHMHDNNSHKVDGRIVSISQPHIRPIVRGKSGRNVEFGAKNSISVVGGYNYLNKISWDAYNEGKDLISDIESYRSCFGFYPEYVSADDIYGNRENRRYMKEKGIKYTGKALGRRAKSLTEDQKKQNVMRTKMSKKRSQVEGVFGVGKRKYDLGLVKAKRSDTSESWIGMVYLVMDIARFLRVIFCSILEKGHFLFKSSHMGIVNFFTQAKPAYRPVTF